MNNVDIMFPIDPNSNFTQVISSQIQINFIMISSSKYENIYHNLILVETNYEQNDSEISLRN